MHILITNDDGVFAPGLLALVEPMRRLGKVTILGPDRNWSASGHVKTLHRPLRVKPVQLQDGSQALASDGAPSDCVALALLGVVPEKIDLVVSGINPHANLSYDVTYSGTVTAAMEAVIGGIPGVAVSLDSPENYSGKLDYAPAARVACQVVSKIIQHGLPGCVLLNVNVPYLPHDQIKGWKVTRMGLRVYRDKLERRTDPRGQVYYWIGGDPPTGIPEQGTDIGALSKGMVSISPLQLDLTAHSRLEAIEAWGWGTP